MTTNTPEPVQSKTAAGGKGVSVKKTAGIGKGTPGPGRGKGTPNKENKLLREMILEALSRTGGVDYLAAQAEQNPKAFLSLLGRVLPLQVAGDGGGAVRVIIQASELDERI